MNNRSRSNTQNDGVLRDISDRVYCKDIHDHTYKYLYDNNPEFELYKENESSIDLSNVLLTSFNVGDHICGDLDLHIWFILR